MIDAKEMFVFVSLNGLNVVGISLSKPYDCEVFFGVNGPP